MDLGVRVDSHIGLYVWHARMLANGCYKHWGYVHVCHSIVVVVTCIVNASLLVYSYAHVLDSHAC